MFGLYRREVKRTEFLSRELHRSELRTIWIIQQLTDEELDRLGVTQFDRDHEDWQHRVIVEIDEKAITANIAAHRLAGMSMEWDQANMAASKNLKITIDADSAAAFAAAIMKLGDAGKAAAAAMSGAAAGIKQMAQQAATMANMESGVVSRGEFKLLADKFARCSQRMSMILSLISPDELKRMGLLNADYQTSEIDGFDRVVILEALDRKVEQFNQAHQRLTGQRKRLQDPGRMELTQEEMAFVFALKSAGKSQKEVLRELEKRRKTTK